MTRLLRADALDASEALQRCVAALRGVAPTEVRLARFADGERGEDLVVVAGWFALASRLAPGRDADFEARRAWDELRRELEAAASGAAKTPLGRLLAGVLTRHRLSTEPFAAFLTALGEGEAVAVRQTRDEVLGYARSWARPWARALLPLLRADGERSRVLAEAVGIGCLLGHWWASIGREWRLNGRLRVPMEDLAPAGVDLARIDRRSVGAEFRELLAAEGMWALEWLGKGWALTGELGPWRGRLLAACLRRRLVDLVATVRRGGDLEHESVRAPRWRVPLTVAAGLASRRRPRPLAGER